MALPPYLVENWTEYGVGASVLLLRMYARSRMVGILPSSRWHGDDFLAFAVLALYTVEACSIHVTSKYFSILPLVANPKLVTFITPEQARSARINGHLQFLGWNSYIHLIWCLKASLLFLYKRLTRNLIGVKHIMTGVVAFVAVTYLMSLGSTLFHCFPIEKNWEIYPHPDKCILSEAHAMILFATNLSSDLALFCIPVYLLWKVQYSIKKKTFIAISLCSGIFAMAAIIMRNIFVLMVLHANSEKQAKTVTQSLLEWSVREPFVSVVIVNIPSITPLFNRKPAAKSTGGSPVGTSSRLKDIINKRLGRDKITPKGVSTTGGSTTYIVDEVELKDQEMDKSRNDSVPMTNTLQIPTGGHRSQPGMDDLESQRAVHGSAGDSYIDRWD